MLVFGDVICYLTSIFQHFSHTCHYISETSTEDSSWVSYTLANEPSLGEDFPFQILVIVRFQPFIFRRPLAVRSVLLQHRTWKNWWTPHSLYTFYIHLFLLYPFFGFAVQKKLVWPYVCCPRISLTRHKLASLWAKNFLRFCWKGTQPFWSWGCCFMRASLCVLSKRHLIACHIKCYPPANKHYNGKSPFLMGDTFSCGCFSIVILVFFWGGITCHPHSLRGFLCHPTLLAGDWGQSTTSSKWRMILLQQIYRF